MDGRGSEPYACVPTAACVVLAYFGHPEPYVSLLKDIPPGEDGSASMGALARALERRQLHCRSFSGLGVESIESYLKEGCCAVVVVSRRGTSHASTLFMTPEGMTSVDMLREPHPPDRPRLQQALGEGAVVTIVGRSPIPGPSHGLRWWALVSLSAVTMIGLLVVVLRCRVRAVR